MVRKCPILRRVHGRDKNAFSLYPRKQDFIHAICPSAVEMGAQLLTEKARQAKLSDCAGAYRTMCPPKRYLGRTDAKNDMGKEVSGLLKGRPVLEPPLAIIDIHSSRDSKWRFLPAALIAKVKPNGVANAMICVRGGCMQGAQSHVMSAPPSDRSRVLIMFPCAINRRYYKLMCDIVRPPPHPTRYSRRIDSAPTPRLSSI